jgi:hypothetical protein
MSQELRIEVERAETLALLARMASHAERAGLTLSAALGEAATMWVDDFGTRGTGDPPNAYAHSASLEVSPSATNLPIAAAKAARPSGPK